MKNLSGKLGVGALIIGVGILVYTPLRNSYINKKQVELDEKYKISIVKELNYQLSNPLFKDCSEAQNYADSLKSIKDYSEAEKQYTELETKRNTENTRLLLSFLSLMGLGTYLCTRKKVIH